MSYEYTLKWMRVQIGGITKRMIIDNIRPVPEPIEDRHVSVAKETPRGLK
jgi:hypothetical protein